VEAEVGGGIAAAAPAQGLLPWYTLFTKREFG